MGRVLCEHVVSQINSFVRLFPTIYTHNCHFTFLSFPMKCLCMSYQVQWALEHFPTLTADTLHWVISRMIVQNVDFRFDFLLKLFTMCTQLWWPGLHKVILCLGSAILIQNVPGKTREIQTLKYIKMCQLIDNIRPQYL